MAPGLIPMLASQSKVPLGDLGAGWAFEPKYDGIRCLAPGDGRLLSRSGNDITARFPEIAPPDGYALDGEVIITDPDTCEPSFALVSRRTARNAATADRPAVYVVFDVLAAGGDDTRRLPYEERRGLLRAVPLTGQCQVIAQQGDGPAMWDLAMQFGMEGVVAKHLRSAYHPGRSDRWLKLKKSRRVSCVVVGAERGSGHRAGTFGALFLALRDGGGIREVGKVGSGFDAGDLAAVIALLAGGQPFVVDVDCMEITAGGRLRFPVYVGVRDDISVLDCTVDQLRGGADARV
jgi:bifunctional non-homologous end joining protein LigD